MSGTCSDHSVRKTSRSESGYGSGRSRIALTKLKMALLAPMPRARVRRATSVKPRPLASIRAPNLTSCQRGSMVSPREDGPRPGEARHATPPPGGGLPSLALLPRLGRRAQSGGHSLARQGLETLAVGVAHGPRAAGEDLERAPALERER